MTEYDVRRLALVLAVQAKIEAMKADNNQRPNDQRYTETDFYAAGQELETLAYKHDFQL